MLTKEQADSLREQIINQIQSTFPEDKKDFAIKRIVEMTSDELEQFLIKNGLTGNPQSNSTTQPCVFCSIVAGQISSHKIDENEGSIAVLEINPISRGHVIIIPKEHLEEDKSKKSLSSILAEKVSKTLKTILKPKKIILAKSSIFGHDTINLIPKYNDETENSERHPAKQEDLSELQKVLSEETEKKEKKQHASKEKTKEVEQEVILEKLWLPRRIP